MCVQSGIKDRKFLELFIRNTKDFYLAFENDDFNLNCLEPSKVIDFYVFFQ